MSSSIFRRRRLYFSSSVSSASSGGAALLCSRCRRFFAAACAFFVFSSFLLLVGPFGLAVRFLVVSLGVLGGAIVLDMRGMGSRSCQNVLSSGPFVVPCSRNFSTSFFSNSSSKTLYLYSKNRSTPSPRAIFFTNNSCGYPIIAGGRCREICLFVISRMKYLSFRWFFIISSMTCFLFAGRAWALCTTTRQPRLYSTHFFVSCFVDVR
mmetsp:Transcript_15467/g.18622  ORF Transcript_15467/g.18622 Transcript_15467/m.18622 type:complete len:208 (-) Transcript_15467:665-1288(-)